MKESVIFLTIIILFSGCVLFQKSTETPSSETFRFNGIYHTMEDGFAYSLYNDSTEIFFIDTIAIVRFSDFLEVEKRKDKATGGYDLFIKFNEEATKRFAKATKEHIKEPFAIILQNKFLSAPTVMNEIT